MDSLPDFDGLLLLPHIRVQNANAVSSPLTWGFSSITAFVGLMWALERKISPWCELYFQAVGVICHAFEPQVTQGGYIRSFRLTRNPVKATGETAAIVEEGRSHLEISLIFAVNGPGLRRAEQEQQDLARRVLEVLSGMRVAGGSVLPPRHGLAPQLQRFAAPDDRAKQFHTLRRTARLLPGCALLSRQDLLQSRLEALRAENPQSSFLDAWLDLSRLNLRSEREEAPDGAAKIVWKQIRAKKGWIVPIPVGYAALSPLYPPGAVENARDAETPFRFVESLYSIGEWKGLHRLGDVRDVFWYAQYDEQNGLYLCRNDWNLQATGE